MSPVMETKREICPFTLEICEDCCERKILNHKKICSFTLEPCYFNMTGVSCPSELADVRITCNLHPQILQTTEGFFRELLPHQNISSVGL